jgi:hypothetical protein
MAGDIKRRLDKIEQEWARRHPQEAAPPVEIAREDAPQPDGSTRPAYRLTFPALGGVTIADIESDDDSEAGEP